MAMNLGEERLQAVSTSRPELIHTVSTSAHSIAASEEFYSFSERSDSPDESDVTTVIRHQSPEDTRQLNPPRPILATTSHPEAATTPRRFPLSRSNTQHSTNTTEPDPLSPSVTTVRHASSVYGDETPRPNTMVGPSNDCSPIPPSAAFVSEQPVSEGPRGQQYAAVSRYSDAGLRSSAAPSTQRTAEGVSGDQYPTIYNEPYRGQRPLNSVAAAVVSENSGVQVDDRYSMRSSGPTPPPKNQECQRQWRSSIAQPVPTPGVDTTPELHFALDQLTRDEEIRGNRYSTDSWGYARPATRDSERLIGVADPRVSRGSDSGRPLASPVSDQRASAGSEDPGSLVSSEYRKSLTPPRKPVPVRATSEALILPPTIQSNERTREPGMPTQTNRESTQSWLSAASEGDANFNKEAQYNSLPDPLRWWSLLGLIFLCMFFLAALVVSSVHSALSYGLNRYDGTGTSLYFVFRYLPQLFAAIVIVWLHQVQNSIQRILPFLLIRSNNRKTGSEVLRTTPRFLSNYLLPSLAPFQDGEIGLGLCNLVFWLTLFTVPLASTLYTPIYFSQNGSGYWRWSAVQGVCWTLIPLIFLLTISLIFILFKFNFRPTGLRWDPRSIADVLVLLRRLNSTIRRRSDGPETGRFDYRPASLGLWRSSSDPNNLTHGIGVPRDLETGQDISTQPPPSYQQSPAAQPALQQVIQHHSTFESWKSGHGGYHGWLPWFMRPAMVALWIAIALVLMIALLAVSWVKRAAVQTGFDPQLPAGPNAHLNFSSANFLWSFLPALLGMFLYLFWLPFDAFFRAVQPYVTMQTGNGATASKSVLLEYPAQIPFMVSIHALTNGHLRVAWISFVPLIAIVIPVLAGGVFQAQYIVGSGSEIREIGSIPGYIALCVFVAVYALSFPLLWPSRKLRLPENIKYVSSVGDFVVGGQMLNESTWREPQTKSDLVGRLMMSRGLTGEKTLRNGLFRFGHYVDVEGRERIGIHRE